MPSLRLLLVLATGFLLAPGWAPPTPAVGGDDVDFFERKIRPVLVEHCYSCHSVESASRKKLRGGLKLDSRAGLLRGGDSGPAVEPGKPDESPLITALRHEDGLEMPPKGKLPDAVIADFVAWVERGAPDPRAEPAAIDRTADQPSAASDGRGHWAYQPPVDAPPPPIRDRAWPAGSIDRFLLARLEAAGLRPAPEADRASLIRRLSYDLHGLPPSVDEIEAFATDGSPDAYERLVDRLLGSPRFGERWGRHWLDVARFGESLTLRGLVLTEAWRYRDFVVDAFNADLPFDQFIREQIAGDLLPTDDLETRRRRKIALTFLLMGNTNLEDQDKAQLEMDFVDEQIDVIGKGVLAQTITCARCHDHKFDPIPTADYYATAAILHNARAVEHANVSKWIDAPLPMSPEREAAVAAHEARTAELTARIKTERARLAGLGRTVGGVVAARDLPGVVVDDSQARAVGAWMHSQFSKTYIGAGYLHDENAGKGAKTLTFQPRIAEAGEYEARLAYAPGGGRAQAVPVTILSADGETTVHVDMRAAPPIDGRFVALGRFRFEKNGSGYVMVSNEGTTGHVTADAVQFVPVGALARESTEGDESTAALQKLEAELKRLNAHAPVRDMAMSLVESPRAEEGRILIRGDVHSPGAVVPRGWLKVASRGALPVFPSDQSGRRELADWLVSADNPLTPRVIVNRAWHWLFGAGLVRTVDNFGTTGEAPSHPELLDWLAVRFMKDGWSVKSLVRRVVLSKAYRLAAADDPRSRAADPENRLLGRASRRRLDAECLRDAMLSASGRLCSEMGGRSFPAALKADYGFHPDDSRRSVYEPVFRNALPEIFTAFDFADPSLVVGRRNTSTVAPQALYLMNNPFVLEQARAAAVRLLSEPSADDARLDAAFLRVLGRVPTEGERRIMLDFIARASAEKAGAEETWTEIVHVLFESTDFRNL